MVFFFPLLITTFRIIFSTKDKGNAAFCTLELLQPILNIAKISISVISFVIVSDIFIEIPAHFICVSLGLGLEIDGTPKSQKYLGILMSGVAVRQVLLPEIKRKQSFSRKSVVTR